MLEKKQENADHVRVMLLDSVDPSLASVELPVFVQRKFDGLRCCVYLRNGQLVMQSRGMV
jgi:hypothetical protein